MDRVQMINLITGTEMSVPGDLVEKYLAAGHKLAPSPVKEEDPAPAPAKKPARKKTAEK